MASTVLPNGIIIPEKYSRDWYADLYHNWQELDNLLGGGTPKDGTLTIQKNGDTVGTFSANQATDETINIEVPTKTSDLNNDSGFITGVTWNDVADKPSFATVATSGSYNDLSNKPTIPTVNNATLTIQKNGANVQTFTANQSTNATANITVPTKTSDLTNDSGFITSDNTKIPLAGSNQISGSLIPSTDNSIDIGSSTKNIKMLYTKGITIDGTQFLPSDYIPRSGGVVLTGTNFFRTTTDSSLHIGGGTSQTDGGSIQLYGDDGYYPGDVIIRATKPNDNLCTYFLRNSAFYPLTSVALGSSYYKWGQIYSTNSTISTSDERQKDNIKQIDDKLLQAWENVNTVQFNFKDALEKKGENARLHTGYIAQNIQQACEEKGVNPNDYGLFCFDSWEEQEEKKDENGEVIEPYRAKGDLYSLRYEEALVVECAYLRKCIKELRNEIEELKSSK